jgi:hypothetical protein
MILNHLYKNLNFEQSSHRIRTELTRITHISVFTRLKHIKQLL